MLRLCLFNGQRRRMRGPICFDGPTHQEQTQNDTQDILFLFGQALHARQYSSKLAGSQWGIGLVVNDLGSGDFTANLTTSSVREPSQCAAINCFGMLGLAMWPNAALPG
jgi:hypothetical protein